MNIRVLGAHSNETLSSKCTSILIDDKLAIDAGALTSFLSLKNQSKVSSILLTHAHFDHVKDLPLIALNLFRMNRQVNVYALPDVSTIIKKHLLNGRIYPRLHILPKVRPTIVFHSVTPLKERLVDKYHVMTIPVDHDGCTVGYRIRDSEGKTILYTADTGPGLHNRLKKISCDLLITETSFSNSYRKYACDTGHLTPDLLFTELTALKKIQGVLPKIVIMHRDPVLEQRINKELIKVAEVLKTSITLASEGMRLNI